MEGPSRALRVPQETLRPLETPEAIRALAMVELQRAEALADDFVAEQRREYASEGDTDPELEESLVRIRKEYSLRKKGVVATFVSKYKKLAADAMVVFALVSHLGRQKTPELLEPRAQQSIENRDTAEPTWNAETRKELEALSIEYAELVLRSNLPDQPSQMELRKRFMDFVRAHLPHAQLYDLKDRSALHKKVDNVFFSLLDRAGQADTTPRATSNIWYPQKPVKERLNNFIEETPHIINRDMTWQRGVQYAERLVHVDFKQSKMYEDVYSNEFQAHSITQHAVQEYLVPSDGKFDVDFAEMYNTIHAYYRVYLQERRGFETAASTTHFFEVIKSHTFSSLKERKGVIFENIKRIRDVLDAYGERMPRAQKGHVFDLAIRQSRVYEHPVDGDALVSALGQADELRAMFLDDTLSASQTLEKTMHGIRSAHGQEFTWSVLQAADRYDYKNKNGEEEILPDKNVYTKILKIATSKESSAEEKASAVRLAQLLEYLELRNMLDTFDTHRNAATLFSMLLHRHAFVARITYDHFQAHPEELRGPWKPGDMHEVDGEARDLEQTIALILRSAKIQETDVEKLREHAQRIRDWGE